MLANQILQKILADISQIINEDCSIWNAQGECLVSTVVKADYVKKDVMKLLHEAEDRSVQVTEENACFVIRDDGEVVYILAIHNVVDNVSIMGKLCVNQFENMLHVFERRVDRNRFFQQLLLDNMLLVDIYNQAKKLNVETEAKRVVFVVEPKKEKDNLVLETLKGLYATGTKDFVTSVDEGHIILIKTLETTDGYKEVKDVANTIVDMLSTEAMVQTRVAFGTIVQELKDVSRCYKEASMALDVGRIFYVEKDVLAYNELGIGRLIHQLPLSLCEMFLEEVFHGTAIDQFDKETLTTVNTFFENNLNISETARQMYLHRNTLGYRLDKVLKTTGLDVKKFEDALTFKIALMVSANVNFMKNHEFK